MESSYGSRRRQEVDFARVDEGQALHARLRDGVVDLLGSRDVRHDGLLAQPVGLTLGFAYDDAALVGPRDGLPDEEEAEAPILSAAAPDDGDDVARGEHQEGHRDLVGLRLDADQLTGEGEETGHFAR